MAPVNKKKLNKTPRGKKPEKKMQNPHESAVVSGQLQKKIDKKQPKSPKDLKGVVFIKNLPHGFFEEQLKKYFEQFGDVTRLRLARSKRTGNSKGYAFVEFEYPEVAEVAAETMDNYLMFKHIVKASYIPPEKQQFNYFRTSVKKIRNKSGKLVWVSGKTANIQQKVKKHNDWSEENFQKRTQRQLKKLKKIGEKYAHLGININELVVQPKILTEEEKLKVKSEKDNKKELQRSSKATKRTAASSQAPLNKEKVKKAKNKISLEDLLGNTLQEDSQDEDYEAMSEEVDSAESGESSDEEAYGIVQDSEDDDEEEETEDDSDKEASPIMLKKSKNTKVSNVERFNEILKRKPHVGGIRKLNKKVSKLPSTGNKKKAVLKMAAAKELAKPLSKVKVKLSGPLKNKKSLIKVK